MERMDAGSGSFSQSVSPASEKNAFAAESIINKGKFEIDPLNSTISITADNKKGKDDTCYYYPGDNFRVSKNNGEISRQMDSREIRLFINRVKKELGNIKDLEEKERLSKALKEMEQLVVYAGKAEIDVNIDGIRVEIPDKGLKIEYKRSMWTAHPKPSEVSAAHILGEESFTPRANSNRSNQTPVPDKLMPEKFNVYKRKGAGWELIEDRKQIKSLKSAVKQAIADLKSSTGKRHESELNEIYEKYLNYCEF